jgi:tRNA uridine 5-carboxymethylaminomethyl modification enzyme
MLTSAESTPITTGATLAELLRRPQIDLAMLRRIDKNAPEMNRADLESVETAVKYEGYIKKQLEEAERQKKLEDMRLPADVDYKSISGLRIEAAEKMNKIRPASVGQASRISGVNPADVTVLLIRFKGQKG